jgi:futalosine hydrolase
MQILLISATPFEVEPLVSYLSKQWKQENSCVFSKKNYSIEILYTGVGSVATTYNLQKKLLQNAYDLVIQAGVAGAFSDSIALGSVWAIASDCFADLGAEDHDILLSVFDLGLCKDNESPFTQKRIVNQHLDKFTLTIPRATAITVQSASGSERSIAQRRKWEADLESMEGAAFHYVCQLEELAYIQVRSVSNYIIPRDRSTWKMQEAIASLNQFLIEFMETISL